MTRDVVRFGALLESLAWGRNVYTIIRVPSELYARAAQERTRRCAGTINAVEVNVGLNRADVIPDAFIYVGKQMLKHVEAAPGDIVECVLGPVDPDVVPVPDDVRSALREAGREDAFERLPAAQRRRLLAPVEGAARAATRARRIEELARALPLT
jgi:hypothetical protein